MKIKRSELDAAIAVEVMGWDRDKEGWWCKGEKRYRIPTFFSPSTDLNHAFEALEKWCESLIYPYIETEFDGKSWECICHRIVYNSEGGYEEYKELGKGDNISLAIAICLALLSAVRGEQVELEKEAQAKAGGE